MKVQFDADGVRLRVSNAELGELRAGGRLVAALQWPGLAWRVHVEAADALAVRTDDAGVHVSLPRASLDALAARLPARDGLRWTVVPPGAPPFELRFDVDLHDGRARR